MALCAHAYVMQMQVLARMQALDDKRSLAHMQLHRYIHVHLHLHMHMHLHLHSHLHLHLHLHLHVNVHMHMYMQPSLRRQGSELVEAV